MNNAAAIDPNDPRSLLRLGDAWRCRAGLTTLMATFTCVAVLFVLGAASHSAALTAFLGLVSFVVYLFGSTAAGTQFMELATGKPVRGTLLAVISVPMIVLRSLGLALTIVAVFLAFMLLAAILLLICKVPFFGTVLYVVVLPLLTFAAALLFLTSALAILLAAPALWEGQSLKTTLWTMLAMVSGRPVDALLNLMLLFLVAIVVSVAITGFILAGFGMATALSAGILGGPIVDSLSGPYGPMMGGMGRYGGELAFGGQLMAGMLGGAIILAVTEALIGSLFLLGLARVYLKLKVGVDLAATEAAMFTSLSKMKENALQKLEHLRTAHEQRHTGATESPSQGAPSAAQDATNCPSCGAPITAEAVFCSQCGHRLK